MCKVHWDVNGLCKLYSLVTVVNGMVAYNLHVFTSDLLYSRAKEANVQYM